MKPNSTNQIDDPRKQTSPRQADLSKKIPKGRICKEFSGQAKDKEFPMKKGKKIAFMPGFESIHENVPS